MPERKRYSNSTTRESAPDHQGGERHVEAREEETRCQHAAERGGGWSKSNALLFNLLSASTFLLGSLLAYAASHRLDVSFLVPFAAGNFVYIGASDLVPEVNRHRDPATNVVLLVAFVSGIVLLLAMRMAAEPELARP